MFDIATCERKTLVCTAVHFREPGVEDKQISEERAWNDGKVDRKNRTDQNPRPLRGKHVDANSPFCRVSSHNHPREKTEGRDQDTDPGLMNLFSMISIKIPESSDRLAFSTLTIFEQFFESVPRRVATKF